MGMADDMQLMQMLRHYQMPLAPEQPAGYQPMPQMPPAPMGPYQQFMGGLQPFLPEIPGLMQPEAAGTPKQTLGVGRFNPGEYLMRYNRRF
jgi:hypothetical protein